MREPSATSDSRYENHGVSATTPPPDAEARSGVTSGSAPERPISPENQEYIRALYGGQVPPPTKKLKVRRLREESVWPMDCTPVARRQEIIEFRYPDLRRLTGPIVYAWVRGYTVLYVGMSKSGIARVFGKHEKLALSWRDRDRLVMWPCESVEEAAKLERRLIRRCRPELNEVDNPDSRWERGIGRHKVPLRRRHIPEFKSRHFRRGNARSISPPPVAPTP